MDPTFRNPQIETTQPTSLRLAFPSRPFSPPKTQLGRNAFRSGDPGPPGHSAVSSPRLPQPTSPGAGGGGYRTAGCLHPLQTRAQPPGAGAQDEEQCAMLKPCDLTPPQAPTPSPGTGSWQDSGGCRGSGRSRAPARRFVWPESITQVWGGGGAARQGARLDGWQVPPTPRFKVIF